MSNRYAIILAAGQGTRMKSKLYKVCTLFAGNQWYNMLSIKSINFK